MADHLTMLLRLAPRGIPSYDPGSLAYLDLVVFAEGLDVAWSWRDALLDEVLIDTATLTLEDWERNYDIHRTSGTDAERQDAVIARIRRLPDFNPTNTLEPIYELVAGIDVEIIEPGAFRCDDANSLCDTTDDILEGTFFFYVQMDHATATAAGVDEDELQETVEDTKPAHVSGTVRFEGFYCDDDWSRCDQDTLGA